MKYIWEYSKTTEAQSIIFTAADIANFFFQKAGYFIFPRPLKKFYQKTVYFPDLDYKYIKDFWIIVSKKEYDIPVGAPNTLIKAISNRLSKGQLLTNPDINDLKIRWKKEKERFSSYMRMFFPDIYNSRKNIIIRPSRFGSEGSYCIKSKSDINLYIRFDAPVTVIARLILLCTVHSKNFKTDTSDREMLENSRWFSKQGIADFLIRSSVASEFIRYPKLSILPAKLVKQSRNYLKKIGFLLPHKLVILRGKIFDSVTNKFIETLTVSENEILKLLIKNKGKVVTFETIGNILWNTKVQKRYSFYAITKLISDIRKKLKDEQIFEDVIFTKRKEGYVYY